MVVLEVYDICNPVLPVRAAISAVVEQDAAGAWFAVVPLDFRLVWASSSASFLGVLDINLDPNLAAFMDPNDTKASSQLVRATVMEAGSSGHFKADNDTASGDASASPEVKSSELRAAHLREREADIKRKEADQARVKAEEKQNKAEKRLDAERKTREGLEAELAQKQKELGTRPPKRGVKRKDPPEDNEGTSPTKTKLINNSHQVTMGILALANNIATGNKQISVAAAEAPPQLKTQQQELQATADAILSVVLGPG